MSYVVGIELAVALPLATPAHGQLSEFTLGAIAEGVPAVIAPARVPKEEPDRHLEHLKLDAVDQVLAVPIKDRRYGVAALSDCAGPTG